MSCLGLKVGEVGEGGYACLSKARRLRRLQNINLYFINIKLTEPAHGRFI